MDIYDFFIDNNSNSVSSTVKHYMMPEAFVLTIAILGGGVSISIPIIMVLRMFTRETPLSIYHIERRLNKKGFRRVIR